MAIKCNHAQNIAQRLQDTVFAGARPVICRNVTITSQADSTMKHVDHLHEALCCPDSSSSSSSSSAALHGQCAGSEDLNKPQKSVASMPTEGTLTFDLAQASVGTVPREAKATSRRARLAAERSQALTEAVALCWQGVPIMASEEEDVLSSSDRAESGSDSRRRWVAQLMVRVAHVCAGNSSTAHEKVLQSLLSSEQEVLVCSLCIEHSSASMLVWWEPRPLVLS